MLLATCAFALPAAESATTNIAGITGQHNEKPARVMWYTVWDAKTGDLLASGTSEMCARRLGYKSANSFASAVSHGLSGSHRTYKYTFARERIDRSEVDSLPPVRTIRKKPAGAPTPTSCKG